MAKLTGNRRVLIAGLTVAAITLAGGAVVLSAGLTSPASPPPGLTDARRLADARQYGASLRIVADTLPNQPDDPATLALLGELYAAIADPATGEPNPGDATAAVQNIATALRETVRMHPESTDDRILLGEYALAAGQYGTAATLLKHATRPDSSLGVVTVPLAIALLRVGRLDELVDTVDPNDAMDVRGRSQALLARAAALQRLARYDDARASLVALLWRDPGNLRAKTRLGLLELEHGSRGQATYWLGQARSAAPDAPETLSLAGEYDFAIHDYAASAAAYGRLVSLRYSNRDDAIPPDLGKARALIYQGDLSAATIALDRARLASDDARLGFYRALLASRAGAFSRAAELAEGLESRLPNFPPLDLLMGGTMLATGFPETAARHLRRYLTSVPANAGARVLLEATEQRLSHPNDTATISPQILFSAFGFPADPADRAASNAAAAVPREVSYSASRDPGAAVR